MPDQRSPNKVRFAAIRTEARRRIEARRCADEELARKVAGHGANASDLAAFDTAAAANEDNFDEFEACLFEDLADWLDEEDQCRTVTIDELMQIGTPSEEKGFADERNR